VRLPSSFDDMQRCCSFAFAPGLQRITISSNAPTPPGASSATSKERSMNVKSVVVGSLLAALAGGAVVSCGGGSGGYGGGGGGGGVAAYSVGGTLSGATGSVVLKLNGGSDMTVSNGSFTFATMVAYLSTYNVQVVDASDRCAVANGAGTMGVANVTNVAI